MTVRHMIGSQIDKYSWIHSNTEQSNYMLYFIESTTFDRRHLTAGCLAAGHLTVRHLTPSRFYRGQLTAKACKRIVMVSCLSVHP